MSVALAIADTIVVVNGFSNDELDVLNLYTRELDWNLDGDLLDELNIRDFEDHGYQSYFNKRAPTVHGLPTHYTLCSSKDTSLESIFLAY